MDRTPTPRHLLSTLAASALLAAYVYTPQLDAHWTGPGLGAHSALLHGAKVLVVPFTPSTVNVDSGPSFSIGGVGFGRSSAAGVGVSAPLGNGRVTTGFQANGRVTDVSMGRLAYTERAAAAPSADLDAQFAAMAKPVLDSVDRAGLF